MSKRQRRRVQDRRRHHAKLAAAGLGVGATLVITGSAQAATVQVMTTGDPGGACPGGSCGLRGALTYAGSHSGTTITFGSGVTGTISPTSTLAIPTNTTIQGPGSSVLTVSGGNAQRIFTATGTDTISGLTLSGGNAGHVSGDNGGAIQQTSGNLTLTGDLLTGNTAKDGGAIDMETTGGTLTITNSVISGNTASGLIGGKTSYGGGIHAGGGTFTNAGGTNVVVSGSVVSGNHSNGYAGGYGHEGGIDSYYGSLTILNSTVSGNTASKNIGGIEGYRDSLIDIEGSTVSGNSAPLFDGGLYGTTINSGHTVIKNSTFQGNSAKYTAGLGVYSFTTPPEIDDTTISGNTATKYVGGLRGSPGTVIQDTIVAGNTAGTSEPDLFHTTFNAGFSLIGNTSGGATIHDEIGGGSNLLNVNPQLGPLANNGGPTKTMKPALTSPAINKGLKFGLTKDQRGLTRPVACDSIPNSTAPGADGSDIGAVELQASECSSSTGGKVSCTLTPLSKKVVLGKKKKSSKAVLSLSTKCNQTATLSLTGKVTVVLKGKHKSKTFTLSSVSGSAASGKTVTLKINLPKGALKLLKKHDKESVTFTLTASNANGSKTTTATIKKLKLGKHK